MLRDRRILAIVVAILSRAAPSRVLAWDSRTHMLIARLAIDALPASSLRRLFEAYAADLKKDAVAPDEVPGARYGKPEAILITLISKTSAQSRGRHCKPTLT
jgi:hypothetical protein